jgi:hypothetical protein
MTWFITMENVENLSPREEVLSQDPGYKMEMIFGKNVITKRTQLLSLTNSKLHPDGNGC